MTAAVHNPDLVANAAAKIGSANLVLAIDAKRDTGAGELRWEVYTHGGRHGDGNRRSRLGGADGRGRRR